VEILDFLDNYNVHDKNGTQFKSGFDKPLVSLII